MNTIGEFLPAGVRLILPGGNAQILFLIAVFLASPRTARLYSYVLAWIVGHTLALWLVGLGILDIPGTAIAWLVPLTIALAAAENLVFREPPKFKSGLVFTYGLIHGFGFALAFRDIAGGGPHDALALAGFNIGLEVAHLAVIGLAMAASLYFRGVLKQASRMDLYRPMIVVPVSLGLFVTGLVWTLQAFPI